MQHRAEPVRLKQFLVLNLLIPRIRWATAFGTTPGVGKHERITPELLAMAEFLDSKFGSNSSADIFIIIIVLMCPYGERIVKGAPVSWQPNYNIKMIIIVSSFAREGRFSRGSVVL